MFAILANDVAAFSAVRLVVTEISAIVFVNFSKLSTPETPNCPANSPILDNS